jgi:primosomal protein N' (replication factor Y)
MDAIARIEPITTARALRGPFDYRLGDDHAGVGVGAALEVPFGGRSVLGVVTGTASESDVPAEKLVAPLRRLDAAVPPDLVRVALWMAEEYCSTRARALQLVLPPGAGRTGHRRALVAELTPAGHAALEGGAPLTTGQAAALGALREQGSLRAAELPGGHSALRRLEARGLVSLASRRWRRRPRAATVGSAPRSAPSLTADQDAALAPVLAALRARPGEPNERRFLLHGVTGSGKTEVYLRAVAATLERGRGAIVLVPEIALTPQIVGRLRARFGATVAILHSQLGEGERYDEWCRVRSGEARVCVGPRSAVFAPVADLGLVVVDEEHDPSYKHEGDPRYDARRVAERRAQDSDAVLLAGSATPRPESFRALRRLRLPERVDGQRLPPVEILDMRAAAHALHPRTRAALDVVRRERRKAIVLLNRRGWSNFLSCRSCGRVWTCPDCDVALVLHRGEGAVTCHHCAHREAVPRRCSCGSVSVARHGAGTERLEHELGEAFAGGTGEFPVFRLDSDIAGARNAVAEVLHRFDAAPAGVLVGTQMVAKGHDFPDVTLAVVLDADGTLRFPDFRSDERTFALIAQLAGRAGRGPGGGRVLVQTLAPDAPPIVLAARHDADAFLAAELARREVLGYPPFSHLIRVVCSSVEPGAADAAAAAIHAQLAPTHAAVLGPAPLFRLRGRERSQLVIKARERRDTVAAVGAAVAAVAGGGEHRQAAFSVDVDPQ